MVTNLVMSQELKSSKYFLSHGDGNITCIYLSLCALTPFMVTMVAITIMVNFQCPAIMVAKYLVSSHYGNMDFGIRIFVYAFLCVLSSSMQLSWKDRDWIPNPLGGIGILFH